VALEVSNEGVVMGGQVTDAVVDFGTRKYDALCMVREARKMYSILLALQFFCVLALLAVVDLDRFVVACYNGKLTRVVEVEGGYRDGAGTRSFEALVQ
jgi:hypothetical protein